MLFNMTINGVDFTPYLRENGVNQYDISRIQKTVITMDGTLYRSDVKKRGIRVQLREVRDTILTDLFAALTSPATVGYTDLELGDVEKTFYVSGKSVNARTVKGGNTYWSGATFTLEEM